MIKEILVKGAVQGVGYRPFIASKAEEFNISGFVKNIGAAVQILAIGQESCVEAFISCINSEMPPGAFILDVSEKTFEVLPDIYSRYACDFTIIESSNLDLSSDIPVFLPDIGICDDCQKELFDRNDYRYRYSLISCAVCGPRLSILNAFPYDRHNTTMKAFSTCKRCEEDYVRSRRRYAQTISCNICGPQMKFIDYADDEPSPKEGDPSVERACKVLENGGIIGLKGVSGYQLVCKPDPSCALRLRAIKGREKKPFAIMFFDVKQIREYAYVSETEEALLKSGARPIVLLKKKKGFDEEVIKDSRYIGAFLPSAGIHSLLTKSLGPLIVTSANKSDEPIITDEDLFISKFLLNDEDENSHCDGVLTHSRKINMPMDDSVVFTIDNGYGEHAQFIRRSRGYVPLPVLIDKKILNTDKNRVVLAFGADLKSTFAFAHGDKIMQSQYIGDLEDYGCVTNYKKLMEDYLRLFKQVPTLYVCDMHPGYISSGSAKKDAEKNGIKLISLQHHFAHTYSVMAENGLTSAIGVSFDGTGYGSDGCIWGGEFLYCQGPETKRLGHLSYVTLTGGDKASKDADLTSTCYLYGAVISGFISEPDDLPKKYNLVAAATDNRINTFRTSSMGRLFDAVSSILLISSFNSYEGECAIKLENAAWDHENEGSLLKPYPEFDFTMKKGDDSFAFDQIKLFSDIYSEFKKGRFNSSAIAYGFHMAIADMIVKGCMEAADKTKEKKVCLSGGVFNNRFLLEKATKKLLDKGFLVFWNKKAPLGDGGISLGQAYYGLLKEKE